jgi:hypothetical protein
MRDEGFRLEYRNVTVSPAESVPSRRPPFATVRPFGTVIRAEYENSDSGALRLIAEEGYPGTG